MNNKLKELNYRLNSLVIFRGLLGSGVIGSLSALLGCGGDTLEKIKLYSAFVSELYKHSENLSEYMMRLVLNDENPYIVSHAQGEAADELMEECVRAELASLQEISRITPDEVTELIDYSGFLPKWKTKEIDFAAEYQKRLDNIGSEGYGIFSTHHVFVENGGEIVPVRCPDPVRLSELYDYDFQRNAVIANTLALLSGRPAQNTLLYGDAGTGKSSTVKAIVNEYADRGLRLIEITKEQLRDIPLIIERISRNPLKFIIFIDDLSFSSDDNCFGALKATLEGTVSAKSDNIAIYATSNRRHLVKESFSDRTGDDVHRNDTIQEQISLSSRFGLSVNFSKPDKKTYLNIVSELAKKNGIYMDGQQLSVEAEAFALAGKGRSARTAKQFINQLCNECSSENNEYSSENF